jgi:C4-dicarboxylate-specific signal transduction histidine kinase
LNIFCSGTRNLLPAPYPKAQQASDDLEKEVMNRTSQLKRAKDNLKKLSTTDGLS